MDRAEKLKDFINKKNKTKKVVAEGGGGAATGKKKSGNESGDDEDAEDDDKKDAETKKLRNALSSAIVTEKPNVKWEDIAGLDNAKEALKEAVILPVRFPQLFTGTRRPHSCWRMLPAMLLVAPTRHIYI